MSIITEYLNEVKRLIDDAPLKLSTKIYEENRGEVALYLRGEIVFSDMKQLYRQFGTKKNGNVAPSFMVGIGLGINPSATGHWGSMFG